MVKTDNGYVEGLSASECRPLLRRELRNAYKIVAHIELGEVTRMIRHSPFCHAPATRLPWPFSKLGMHDVEINHYKTGCFSEIIKEKRFAKDKIDEAIEEFLLGVPANQRVVIGVDNF